MQAVKGMKCQLTRPGSIYSTSMKPDAVIAGGDSTQAHRHRLRHHYKHISDSRESDGLLSPLLFFAQTSVS